MSTQANLPKELTIWNNMTIAQRLEIMSKVPYQKGITKGFRACLAYIKANM